MSFENERRKAQLRMAHGWGYCRTNNCDLGFPQSTGFDMGRGVFNYDPKNINCKDLGDKQPFIEKPLRKSS